MTLLALETSIRDAFAEDLSGLPEPPEESTALSGLRAAFSTLAPERRERWQMAASTCHQLIRENGFVLLRGLPATEGLLEISILACLLGEPYFDMDQQPTITVTARPHPGGALQGNQTYPLPLHTDYCMLEHVPEATIIRCVRPDPVCGMGCNGLAVARDVMTSHFGSQDLYLFKSVSLPFGGTSPNGKDFLVSMPILDPSNEPKQLTRVRFHPSRVHHGFRLRGLPATSEEAYVLRAFAAAARDVRREVQLKAGDILVVNNHSTLHDRTQCSLELTDTGTRGRVTQIAFINQLA